MKKDKTLRTIALGTGRSGPATCALCGEKTEIRHAEVRLMDPAAPTEWRTLCPACVDAGPAGAAERVRARAKDAPELMRLADRVAKIEDWATTKDLNWEAVKRERGYRVLEPSKKAPSTTEVAKFQRYRKGA